MARPCVLGAALLTLLVASALRVSGLSGSAQTPRSAWHPSPATIGAASFTRGPNHAMSVSEPKDWLPLLQELVWPLFWVGVLLLNRWSLSQG